jgi:3',5'-cyclic AMP phosphodiesterase CpdA
MPSVYAISDLHVSHRKNYELLEQISPHPGDCLIVAGDVGETLEHLERTLEVLRPKFDLLLWTPGNHDLWTTRADAPALRGDAKYAALVERCRAWDVVTPEDPYPEWHEAGETYVLAPLFLLYDYSFRPAGVSKEDALATAMRAGIWCSDEVFLDPSPYPSIDAWCTARCELTEKRLAAVPPGHKLVLINHFPMRHDLVRLPTMRSFSIWCGTTRTESWPQRFNVAKVVYGHLHIPRSVSIDGVGFEEVSLGYPNQRRPWPSADFGLRRILGEEVRPC